jgi:hypothetical protein
MDQLYMTRMAMNKRERIEIRFMIFMKEMQPTIKPITKTCKTLLLTLINQILNVYIRRPLSGRSKKSLASAKRSSVSGRASMGSSKTYISTLEIRLKEEKRAREVLEKEI